MKFGITKDFDSSRGKVGNTGRELELVKIDDELILLEHMGSSVAEITSLTVEEAKTLWRMMSIK